MDRTPKSSGFSPDFRPYFGLSNWSFWPGGSERVPDLRRQASCHVDFALLRPVDAVLSKHSLVSPSGSTLLGSIEHKGTDYSQRIEDLLELCKNQCLSFYTASAPSYSFRAEVIARSFQKNGVLLKRTGCSPAGHTSCFADELRGRLESFIYVRQPP